MINNIEENIFNTAINRFNRDKDIRLETENIKEGEIVNGFRFDKLVKFRYLKKEMQYLVEIKFNINNTLIALLLHRKEILLHPLLLITKYVNGAQAEELKKNGIQFIDACGNAYINNYPIYIFIKGNKPAEMVYKNTTYRLFEASGLKIIFALLCYPGLIKKTYRDIAEITNVSLGTVGWIFNDLIRLGFVINMGKKGRKLSKNEELFNRWCAEYNEKLKPKLLINKFTGIQNWWIDYKLNPKHAQWGGEVAANKLTKYIKPQDIIIYVDPEKYRDVVIENKLRKDVNGNIEFFKRFWRVDLNNEFDDIVNPILIYADLINTGNQRVLETAKIIHEKYIDGYIGKN
jgi:hypothetical protein